MGQYLLPGAYTGVCKSENDGARRSGAVATRTYKTPGRFVRAGGVLRRCRFRLQERLRSLSPNTFNAPLMAKFNDEGESEAIRGLAAYTNEIRERSRAGHQLQHQYHYGQHAAYQGRGRTFVQRRFPLLPRRNVRNVRKDTRHSRRNQELGIGVAANPCRHSIRTAPKSVC